MRIYAILLLLLATVFAAPVAQTCKFAFPPVLLTLVDFISTSGNDDTGDGSDQNPYQTFQKV